MHAPTCYGGNMAKDYLELQRRISAANFAITLPAMHKMIPRSSSTNKWFQLEQSGQLSKSATQVNSPSQPSQSATRFECPRKIVEQIPCCDYMSLTVTPSTIDGSLDALWAWSSWASSEIHSQRLEPDHGPLYYKPDYRQQYGPG